MEAELAREYRNLYPGNSASEVLADVDEHMEALRD